MLMGARPRAANEDGAALVAARRRKERTYPELVRAGAAVFGSWFWPARLAVGCLLRPERS